MVNPTEFVKKPFHIRHQEEFPNDLEMLVDHAMSQLGADGATTQDPVLRGLVQQRILLNRAIDVLRNRLTENLDNSPNFIQWHEDLLDVIKEINNV